MKLLPTLSLMLLAATAMAGCTRSMDYDYRPNSYGMMPPKSSVVGVTDLADKRSWVDTDDVKSKSFFMSAGQWKFGLTHKEQDYTPVGTIIRDILVEELQADSVKAKAVTLPAGGSVTSLAQAEHLDYVLTGDVQAFEVTNNPGFVTIEAHRQVNINLNLYNASGQLVNGPENFSTNIQANEGMGVMHSTNVDKLFNETLKPVIKRVVDRVQGKIALESIRVNVAVNGTVYSHTYSVAGL